MDTFDPKSIKKIGIFTSGGDAPGMNAAIRAATRSALSSNYEMVGIIGGYQGILDKHFKALKTSDMGNIIQRGGTILKTGRCPQFLDKKYREIAAQNLKEQDITALICIGGDGSMRGAMLLWDEHKIPTIGLPGTIDNDVYGTDFSIGFDTAVNTAVQAVDKIRDTAFSHDRLFIVEVMGRETGHIALEVGLACGAEEIFIPENPVTVDDAINHIKRSLERGKASSILVTAEGQKPGRAYDLAEAIRKKSGFDAKICILGHVQRGGSPTARDRVLASRMGATSFEALMRGKCTAMVGIQNGEMILVPLKDVTTKKKALNSNLIKLARVLST